MVDASGWKASLAVGADSISQSRIQATRPRTSKAHVLIVEDNELVTGALRILFEETGRRVTVAHSVAEGVAAGEKDPPDLLLLDLSLPDGNGLDVAQRLAELGIAPRATVALTGRDDPASLQRCSEAGVTAVMVKPVPTSELLSKTTEWLSSR